jgi:deoxycytidylate deaminase
MAEKSEAKVAKPSPVENLTGNLFDAKATIKSTYTGELVIALCGPIGSPLHKVAEQFKNSLTAEFGYNQVNILRLSKIIEDHNGTIPSDNEYKRIKALIAAGNELRKKYGAPILAELAVSKIVLDRQKTRTEGGHETYKPRRVCHVIDSIKNQEELDILRLVYGDMLYFVGVFAPLNVREQSLVNLGMTKGQVYELIDQDSGEELDHGQTVRDTFPEADVFLRIDSETDTPLKNKVERFLHLILGTKIITPTKAETAMYLAASASGGSACLSRQVGAAVTDEDGDVLAVGCNDVPQFGGNLYSGSLDAETDKRCWNYGRICFNDREKRLISELLVENLIRENLIAVEKKGAAVNNVLNNSKVKDLIEFSRSVHAEMHAILLSSQMAGARVKQGKLFCTTYPCHSCARHIVAAGIVEVYYIEPYRKSLATKLHDDAITESETDNKKVRILLYDGVAPTRYFRLFKAIKDSRKISGQMVVINSRTGVPKFQKTLEALPTLEALVVKGLIEKKLLPEEAPNGK